MRRLLCAGVPKAGEIGVSAEKSGAAAPSYLILY